MEPISTRPLAAGSTGLQPGISGQSKGQFPAKAPNNGKASPPEKILFVDDEPAVLQGYQRLLRGSFEIDTAVGARAALVTLKAHGPYAIVVSDMRMPGMDGAELLSQVKNIAPDATRMLLTGYATREAAMNAVNEGNIFRFLTKPCDKETLQGALNAGLAQYRMINLEKELLEKTLKASIQVIAEILSLVNPTAFSRSMRLRRYVNHIVSVLGVRDPWKFEIAALLSQLGCVTLETETLEAVYAGRDLSPEQQAAYNAHPLVARHILESIPRMEPVIWMIAHQNQPDPTGSDAVVRDTPEVRQGAEILHAALAFDDLLRRGVTRTEAGHLLSRQFRHMDARVFYSLVEQEAETEEGGIRTCTVEQLALGMILHEDIRTHSGFLIVARGQEVSRTLIIRLKNFRARGAIKDTIRVTMAKRPQPDQAQPLAAKSGPETPAS
jgi:response regulator RpfG family c-di-GMP phosphodiesterase